MKTAENLAIPAPVVAGLVAKPPRPTTDQLRLLRGLAMLRGSAGARWEEVFPEAEQFASRLGCRVGKAAWFIWKAFSRAKYGTGRRRQADQAEAEEAKRVLEMRAAK